MALTGMRNDLAVLATLQWWKPPEPHSGPYAVTMEQLPLQGRTALVTGASRGMALQRQEH